MELNFGGNGTPYTPEPFRPILLLWRSEKQRIRAPQECFKVACGGPEVASELVPDIFDFFDLFFQGK